jgi:hypothetical protein
MTRLALECMMRWRLGDCRCRFEVPSIHHDAGETRVEVFEGAFDAASN